MGYAYMIAVMNSHSYITALALIFFEYLLTFDQEVKLFWRKRLTGAGVLFLANRYTTIIYTSYLMLMNLVPEAYKTSQVRYCHVRYNHNDTDVTSCAATIRRGNWEVIKVDLKPAD